jgi:hypothetical protein
VFPSTSEIGVRNVASNVAEVGSSSTSETSRNVASCVCTFILLNEDVTLGNKTHNWRRYPMLNIIPMIIYVLQSTILDDAIFFVTTGNRCRK